MNYSDSDLFCNYCVLKVEANWSCFDPRTGPSSSRDHVEHARESAMGQGLAVDPVALQAGQAGDLARQGWLLCDGDARGRSQVGPYPPPVTAQVTATLQQIQGFGAMRPLPSHPAIPLRRRKQHHYLTQCRSFLTLDACTSIWHFLSSRSQFCTNYLLPPSLLF